MATPITDANSEEECPFGVNLTSHQNMPWIILGFSLLILLTVAGNLLIILAISLEPKLRTLGNLFYISLASADLLVGLLVMPFMLIYTVHGCWPLGALGCDLWLAVDFLCCTASFYGLCVIARDRYRAIADPFVHRQKQTKTRVRMMIAAMWFCAALAWIPAIGINRSLSGNVHEIECDYMYALDKIYILVSCIFAYYIPIIIMITYITLLFAAIRKRLRTGVRVKVTVSKQNTCSSDGSVTCNMPCAENITLNPITASDVTFDVQGSPIWFSTGCPMEDYGSNMEQKRKFEEAWLRAKKERRAMRMLGLIMAVFLLCWGWWVVTWPIELFAHDSLPQWMYEFSCWAAFLNSGINPFLYIFSNQDFRSALRNIIFRICTRQNG